MKTVTISKLITENNRNYLEISDALLKEIGAVKDSKIFLTPIDGILQISCSEPYIGISMFTLDAKKHQPIK